MQTIARELRRRSPLNRTDHGYNLDSQDRVRGPMIDGLVSRRNLEPGRIALSTRLFERNGILFESNESLGAKSAEKRTRMLKMARGTVWNSLDDWLTLLQALRSGDKTSLVGKSYKFFDWKGNLG